MCNTEDIERLEVREQTLLGLFNSSTSNVFNRFNVDILLGLSLRAKFFQACEIIYELNGQYHEIIECYLNSENSIERQQKVFDVVRNILQRILLHPNKNENNENSRLTKASFSYNFSEIQFNSNYKTSRSNTRTSHTESRRDLQFKSVQQKLLDYKTLKKMIDMNPCECIYLLWIEMNIDLKHLIDKIRNSNKKLSAEYQDLLINNNNDNDNGDDSSSLELLFKFMKGLFDLAELIKPDRKYMFYMSQLSAEYCELYIDLTCLFEPERILFILKTILSDYSYRIDESLRICRERKVWDGAAYLLEKSGQIEEAFELHLEKLDSLLTTTLASFEDTENHVNYLSSMKTVETQLAIIVQLCQRNSSTLNETTKENIWFALFDKMMQPLRRLQLDNCTSNETIEKHQQLQTFLKNSGSFIINSMMGYLSFSTIIDRIVCDPIYGATNFGDIKELMQKMLENCTYEQVLLNTVASLVSDDVHSKMLKYKKYSAKSFAALSTYCNYCSKLFDKEDQLDIDESNSESNKFISRKKNNQNLSKTNDNNNILLSESLDKCRTNNKLNEDFEQLDNANKTANINNICIYHCGHSFHESCLSVIQRDAVTIKCPLCSSNFNFGKFKSNEANNLNNKKSNNTNKKYRKNSMNDEKNAELSSSPTSSLASNSSTTTSPKAIHSNNLNLLTAKQINALKSIRTRLNYDSNLILNGTSKSLSNTDKKTNIEKFCKLKLAPANLSKFIS